MKRVAFLFALSLSFSAANAQSTNELAARLKEIEDRMALKNLVDTFSVLADQKATEQQTLLFTENATVQSVSNGQPGSTLTGRKQIGDAFANFLKNFETVYHINGQQTLTLNGDKASGVSYCQVTLISNEGGKRMKLTMGVYYNDEYVREAGRWLIAKRNSTFSWRDSQPVGQ